MSNPEVSLHELTASQAAVRIARCELSPVDYLEALVKPVARRFGMFLVRRGKLVPVDNSDLKDFFVEQLFEFRRGT